MKLYFGIVGFIVLASAVFGFILPYLISSESDTAVLLGAAIVVLTLPILFYIGKSVYLNFKGEVK